ncbi:MULTISPECIES: HU family DNA-binding protein [Empedobacter]|uniref:HU family DNA-binding protein n=1 Tax=Empedobacter falsenii TaxID=343874 RepID=A0ABY8V5F3_9FLAO|nr:MULTISPECIES: HU family DNA-binding protein [Empedobacter]MCA4777075.1 HU family DNA-binding protein [Empedobacter stercoris]MCA4780774.1 HU family DNA-binding protein [Empedobacter stercoris]MCA4809723.1 HU family DNA-binding protein [Empedobacter stercoris]MDM1522988.1 HU family DNA-binding protein [Empedobacter sp. 225-1]MDM1542946.1 HU family DNA-binding protein [Empedobacter sp. 189-2]
MAIKYNVIQKAYPGDPTGPKKFYANSIADGEISLRRLSKEIAQTSSVSESDVYASLIDLAKMLAKHLADGKIVRLGDFGSFQISISSEGADSISKVTSASIKNAKILFRPGIDLRETLATLKYEKKKS